MAMRERNIGYNLSMNTKNLVILGLALTAYLSLGGCKPRENQLASDVKGNFEPQQVIVPEQVKICRESSSQTYGCMKFQNETLRTTQVDSLILAYVSRLAYEDNSLIEAYAKSMKLDFYGMVGVGPDQAILLGGDNFLIVGFRGTDLSIQDIMTDTKFVYKSFQDGFSHGGFVRAFSRLRADLYRKISEITHNRDRPMQLWFTGHSLGGAIANITAYDFASTTKVKLLGVQTFGAPRVFSPSLVELSSRFIQNNLRFVYENDIVTNLPGPVFFRHAGNVIYMTDRCEVKGEEDGWLPFIARLAKHNPLAQVVNFSGVPSHRMHNYIRCLEELALR